MPLGLELTELLLPAPLGRSLWVSYGLPSLQQGRMGLELCGAGRWKQSPDLTEGPVILLTREEREVLRVRYVLSCPLCLRPQSTVPEGPSHPYYGTSLRALLSLEQGREARTPKLAAPSLGWCSTQVPPLHLGPGAVLSFIHLWVFLSPLLVP